jgi:hypothetical protein
MTSTLLFASLLNSYPACLRLTLPSFSVGIDAELELEPKPHEHHEQIPEPAVEIMEPDHRSQDSVEEKQTTA